MPIEDPRDDLIKNKLPQKRQFEKVYFGDFGKFFDSMLGQVTANQIRDEISGYGEIGDINKSPFPRILQYFLEHQKNWNNSLVVNTNYFNIIANIYKCFVFGEGIRLMPEEKDEGAKTANDDFLKWWKDEEMDKNLSIIFEKTIATGYSGGRMVQKNGALKFEKVNYENYFPEKNVIFEGFNENIIWLYWHFPYDKEKYHYFIRYEKVEAIESNVKIQHFVYEDNGGQFAGTLGKERPDILAKLGGSLGEDGEEENNFTEIPVFIFNNLTLDPNEFGESSYRDIFAHVQALTLLDTIDFVELQKNFTSKVALGVGHFRRENGQSVENNSNHFLVGENDQTPKFIQKDPSFFPPLFETMKDFISRISTTTTIPEHLLQKVTTGDEKVDLAKFKNAPFEKKVQLYQKRLTEYINDIAKAFYQHAGKDPVNIDVIYPDVFKLSESEALTSGILELENGLTTREILIKDLHPNLTNAEVIQRVLDAKKEMRDDEEAEMGDATTPNLDLQNAN